mmetsp:Transcript_9975/g.21937  ORF Transcript_9975/g.21937 Transcript_9975/m.21937 type:complete len:229 (-) Transcript_9975:1428-2114(-)
MSVGWRNTVLHRCRNFSLRLSCMPTVGFGPSRCVRRGGWSPNHLLHLEVELLAQLVHRRLLPVAVGRTARFALGEESRGQGLVRSRKGWQRRPRASLLASRGPRGRAGKALCSSCQNTCCGSWRVSLRPRLLAGSLLRFRDKLHFGPCSCICVHDWSSWRRRWHRRNGVRRWWRGGVRARGCLCNCSFFSAGLWYWRLRLVGGAHEIARELVPAPVPKRLLVISQNHF